MANNKPSLIPNRLKNAAIDGYVAGAVDILDDNLHRNQEDINADIDADVSQLKGDVADRYTKEEVNNILSRTPETDVVVLDVPDGSTAADVLDEVPLADRPNKLFRVRNDDNTKYDEYGWTGEAWALLASKDYGIDDEPTEDSDNMAKSGGITKLYGKYVENQQTGLIDAVVDPKMARSSYLDCTWRKT